MRIWRAFAIGLSPLPLWIGAATGTSWLCLVGIPITLAGFIVFFGPIVLEDRKHRNG